MFRVRKPYCLLAVCGFLLLAVIAVFGQTVNHEFVNFDDKDYIYENQHVRGGLSGEATAWAFTAYHSGNWHPLTWLSHMLDCQLYDLKPGGHHLTNVLLHAATAILLFLTFQRMTGALWSSAWVAAVFAIHPLRVESVAWVAERKDVLSGLLFMLTLWFYARYAERPSSWGRYLLVVASFALGLTAKPMLVTLPFVLLLLDYWPLGRAGSKGQGVDGAPVCRSRVGEQESLQIESEICNRKSEICNPPPTAHRPLPTSLLRLVVEKIPLFVLAAASCVVALAAHRDAMESWERMDFTQRVANAAMAYLAYFGKMLYPAGLAVFYPFPNRPPPAWEVVAAAGMLLAISTAVFVVRQRYPYLLFGWLWYLGTLVPVIGLVQVGNQAMADRYTYLTQIGLYVAIAWGAVRLAGTWPYRRWLFAAVSAPMMAGLMVCTWQQTRHWRDTETLWTHTLACTSQNLFAHYNFGIALAARGRVDEAIAHFQEALQIKPGLADVHNNLGLALSARGQVDDAITHFQAALEIEPNCLEAYFNLGVELARRGQFDEAIRQFRKALRLASARKDEALADVIRARIGVLQSIAPAGKTP